MNYQQVIEQYNRDLRDFRLTWGPTDYKMLAGKATTRGRLLGALSRGYYQRERLWKSGQITYGYLYKTYTDLDISRPYLAWLLFSPLTEFEHNPTLYEEIYRLIEEFLEERSSSRIDRKLIHALVNEVTEAKYYPLPARLTKGKLVYVTTTYVYPDIHTEVKLGITPIIFAPELTKEVMLLPNLFFPLDRRK